MGRQTLVGVKVLETDLIAQDVDGLAAVGENKVIEMNARLRMPSVQSSRHGEVIEPASRISRSKYIIWNFYRSLILIGVDFQRPDRGQEP